MVFANCYRYSSVACAPCFAAMYPNRDFGWPIRIAIGLAGYVNVAANSAKLERLTVILSWCAAVAVAEPGAPMLCVEAVPHFVPVSVVSLEVVAMVVLADYCPCPIHLDMNAAAANFQSPCLPSNFARTGTPQSPCCPFGRSPPLMGGCPWRGSRAAHSDQNTTLGAFVW